MTYKETLDFLFGQLPAYHRIGKAAYKKDLGNIVVLDNYLGNPHKYYRTIHVAGTNGKGSVSHMLASILQEAGYKTGLYTSPHIRDFRERIKVNGRMIDEKVVVDFVGSNMPVLERIKPSFFEMTVAMAFSHFAGEKVDVAVIEVGLGGKLDSTNIIDPLLSVITNIGHDHMDLLGDSLVKIAREKAGIIKKGRPVVISESQDELEKVFMKRAKKTGSEICFADRMYECHLDNSGGIQAERVYEIAEIETKRIVKGISALKGDYQAANIKAVFAAYSILRNILNLSEKNLTDGIRNVVVNTGLEGRWQILRYNPLMICDTGHNMEGLSYVINQLQSLGKNRLHMVIGFVNDKDTGTVLPLFPDNATYYFTRASVPRAMDEITLFNEGSRHGLKGKPYRDVKSAVADALSNAGVDDLIFIGGSTFVVADIV
jgi:dihydrofolate synthase/folylpolyglutamate synthase